MDPSFQRFAATFPLTRPIARRQAQAAFDLCAGFVYSQALLATVRLGLLDRVKAGAVARDALVQDLPIGADRACLVVDAAVALGLLSRRGRGRIGLGMQGAAMLGNPGLLAMIEHHGLVYQDLSDPLALLAGQRVPTRLGAFWPYAHAAEPVADNAAASYSALMTASQAMLAADILESYPFGQHRSVLDVGGGEGAFLAALGARFPDVKLNLFDLPAVADRARERLAAVGLGGRVVVTGGSFFADPLPGGHDLVTLVRIAHDHDDDRVLLLLKAIRRALVPGGTLVIAEPMSGDHLSGRVADVYFAFYLLAMGSGRPRSEADLRLLLREAGFGDVRPIPTPRPMLINMITAKNSKSDNHYVKDD